MRKYGTTKRKNKIKECDNEIYGVKFFIEDATKIENNGGN